MMSNIFGYCKNNSTSNISLNDTISTLLKNERTLLNTTFKTEEVTISQVSLRKFSAKALETEDIILYFYGDIYNLQDIKNNLALKDCPSNNSTLPNIMSLIAEAYSKNILKKFLNQTNGKFNGCLYDKKRRKIFLFTDRFGQNFIYYYHNKNTFAFAGTIPTILSFPNLDLSYDKKSIATFLRQTTLFADRTHFEHIKLIKPASILEYDIASNMLSQSYYWTFKEIPQRNLALDEAITLLSNRLYKAVCKRVVFSEQIIIPTSGGRDSRMLVASLYTFNNNLKTINITSGMEGCGDIQIAKEVCKQANQEHHSFPLKINDLRQYFFDEKMQEAIDSGLSQGIVGGNNFKEITKNFDPSLYFSAYLGEMFSDSLYLSYLQKNHLNTKATESMFNKNLSGFYLVTKNTIDEYFDSKHADIAYIFLRLRRSGGSFFENIQEYHKVIYPLLDNDIIDLLFSIPDEYRISDIYSMALHITFPKFYEEIPWQRTGLPVSFKFSNFSKEYIQKTLKKNKKKYGEQLKNYLFDHEKCIRDPEFYAEIKNLLNYETSLYKNFTDKDIVKNYLEPHVKDNKDFTYKIFDAISLELYLRHLHSKYNLLP